MTILRQWLLWMSLYQRLAVLFCFLLAYHAQCSSICVKIGPFPFISVNFYVVFQVGELIGGSQREERYDVIQNR